MDTAHVRFGPMLRRFRGVRGLSQERLADHAEVSARHVSFLETGRAAPRLLSWALEGLSPPPGALTNALRATLDPRALRSRIVNFDEVAGVLVDRMLRESELEPDPERRARIAAIVAESGVAPRGVA